MADLLPRPCLLLDTLETRMVSGWYSPAIVRSPDLLDSWLAIDLLCLFVPSFSIE